MCLRACRQKLQVDFKATYRKTREGLRTAKGRNILTFFVFLAISTVFWFLLALNDDIQKDYTLPVSLEDFPRNVTLISGINPTVGVSVKDKGSSLMKFSFGNDPKIKLRYDDFTKLNDSVLIINQTQLSTAVRSTFGAGANIIGIRPDSLRIVYTANPPVKVPVRVMADIRTEPRFAYCGHPECSVDSVELYSNSAERFEIESVATRPIVLANLTDTTKVEIPLDVPSGMRAIPSTVRVTFPVEPLVSRSQSVPVEVMDLPPSRKLVTFPPVVEVSYLLPRSMYNIDKLVVKATVDYTAAHSGAKVLPVRISRMPGFVRGVTVNPSHVEYVIERID